MFEGGVCAGHVEVSNAVGLGEEIAQVLQE
jgi:hypothetical protein